MAGLLQVSRLLRHHATPALSRIVVVDRRSQLQTPLILGIFIMVAPAVTQAWELVAGRDPALWSTSLTMLVNPDPNVIQALRHAPALLSLQCDAGRKVVFVNHNFEVAAKSAIVSTSIDGGPTVTEPWRADTSISLEPADMVGFVKRLRGHRDLQMTVLWPGAEPTSTRFDISGLEEALKPLHLACAW